MLRRVLWLTGLLALGGLLVAATAPAAAAVTPGPNVSDATPGNVTATADGADVDGSDDVSGTDDDSGTVDETGTDDGAGTSVGSDPAGSSDQGGAEDSSSLSSCASLSDSEDGPVSTDASVGETPANAAVSNVSLGSITALGQPVVRVLDEVPDDDGAAASRSDPLGAGHVRERDGRSTATGFGAAAGANVDGDRHAGSATTGRASEAARAPRASSDTVATGGTTANESRESPVPVPPGAGLTLILVGLFAVQVPTEGLFVTVERAGRTGYVIGRGHVARFGDRWLPVGPVPGYSRYDSSDPLENDTRGAIYETVRESPGIYFAKLADVTGVAEETVRYHARILEEEGLVEQREVRGRRRLYPLEVDGNRRLAAALEEPAAAAVLAAIERHEPASLSGLADAVDRAPSTMSHHLDRLEADGLVVRERDGDALRVRLQPSVRSELTPDAVAD
jgi:DNA-binding transcriptional ArsR family regulator